MSKPKKKVSKFTLEGRFIGFVGDPEKRPKRLRLFAAEGEHYIKLSKDLRRSLPEILVPGDWIEISGKKTFKGKSGKLKLKAERVQQAAPGKSEGVFQPQVAPQKTKDCIMVCQKSSCCKRGAKEVFQAVNDSLQKYGLQEQVAAKGTGCMKQCKKGPCVVFMPDKSRYINTEPKNIPMLIEKHFAAKLKPAASEESDSSVVV